jgi:hypothetical protein
MDILRPRARRGALACLRVFNDAADESAEGYEGNLKKR